MSQTYQLFLTNAVLISLFCISAIHDTFKLIDKNGDGRLSRSELSKATAILGQTMTEQAITELFDSCDLDGTLFLFELLQTPNKC